MSALVNQLKNEHSALVSILKEAKDLGITTSAGQEKLMSAKAALLGHLQKEDEQLYPKLKERAVVDAGLRTILTTFAKDMEGISTAALEFFKKYENGGETVAFASDFGNLYAALGSRIRKEETLLYAEFIKLNID